MNSDANPNSFESLSFEQLLNNARAGDREATGVLLYRYREYLLKIANGQLDSSVRGKVGSSDIVQESLLTAADCFERFRGGSSRELKAWLRQILLNDVKHEHRKYRNTDKRKIDRERPLQYNSSLEYPLIDGELTPQTNALEKERQQLIVDCLSKLPEDYQQVIRLHGWQDKSLEEVGKLMNRSEEAVRKLYMRALMKYQKALNSLGDI